LSIDMEEKEYRYDANCKSQPSPSRHRIFMEAPPPWKINAVALPG
jgi:hypothetical protein